MEKTFALYTAMLRREVNKRRKGLRTLSAFMKLSFYVLLITLLSAQLLLANATKGQDLETVSLRLELKHASLNSALQKIQEKTVFRFAYRENELNLRNAVTIPDAERTVRTTLELIFKGTGIEYSQVGNNILLFKNQATDTTVQGRVTDETGNGIPGVSIKEKGTSNGTITDAQGHFSITVKNKESILVYSFIGYTTKELAAGQQLITMTEDKKSLSEVVVIGYGTVKKQDATGAVAVVHPDAFNKGSQLNATDALIGKVAGVNIIPGTGAPGDAGTIRIRSGSSLSASNDPLIVVDGVPVDNSTIQGATNILGIINPNDIESYTVLKDASATAIYGSRASNGVIIITTRKGTENGALKLSYRDNFSLATATKKVNVLNADEYRSFIADYYAASQTVVDGVGTANTDWQDQIYRTAPGQEHNLGLSGNIKKMPFRVSLGYNDQDGIVKTNNYKRLTGAINVSPSFMQDHLRVNISVKGSRENNRNIDEGVMDRVTSFDPTRPVHETNAGNYGLGYFTWLSSGGAPLTIANSNPVADLELRDGRTKINRSIGNASIVYKVHGLEDLHFNMNLGYDVLKGNGSEEVPDNAPRTYVDYKKDGNGLDRNYLQRKDNQLLDLYASYNKKIGIHHFDVLGGYGWQHFHSKYNDAQLNHQGVALSDPTHSESEYYLLSFYGRLNYTLLDKYLFTGTLRADASSRFSKENRWGYFPSAAFAWRIDKEQFMKNVKPVSELKLRLSYGQTGQQDIGSDYPYMSTYTASYDNARYLFGDTWYNTYRANGYDPNIKWETNETFNAGLDVGFLKGRITASVDVYHRNTKDLLNEIPVAAGSNLSTEIYTNVGSMKNNGIEFSLNTRPVETKNFQWELGFNLTHNKSEITKLNTIDADSYGVLIGPVSETGKTVQIHAVGYAPYTFYLAQQAYGDDGKPLDGQYVQADGSVSTTTYLRKTHNPAPKLYGGISSRFNYKQWALGFNGHASFGNYIYNYVAASEYKASAYESNTYTNIMKRTLENGFTTQQLYSDYFLENGSFFRMDNITLGYTFPKLGRTKGSLTVSAAVQNVFVITSYSGLDPETFFRSDAVPYQGIDRNLYPRPRTFMLGLNFNF